MCPIFSPYTNLPSIISSHSVSITAHPRDRQTCSTRGRLTDHLTPSHLNSTLHPLNWRAVAQIQYQVEIEAFYTAPNNSSSSPNRLRNPPLWLAEDIFQTGLQDAERLCDLCLANVQRRQESHRLTRTYGYSTTLTPAPDSHSIERREAGARRDVIKSFDAVMTGRKRLRFEAKINEHELEGRQYRSRNAAHLR